MLEFLRIQRFKSLQDASFPLAELNLFTGLNGMGKSSLIQTLLLLRQSHERHVLHRGLLLKGDLLNLGVGQDVLSAQAETNNVEFIAKWQGYPTSNFVFDYAQDSDLQPVKGDAPAYPQTESLFGTDFQYLSADRISPRSQYATSDFNVRDLNSLGIDGEFAIQYIAEFGAKPLAIENLRHPKAKAGSFLESLNGWMSEITPGVQVLATVLPALGVATLGYAFIQGKDKTATFKPQNVGFGLTYVLPVVTAILQSKPGDLVIIENPESHLHPAGQAAIGRLCALAAAGGVQMILESHSDHFLNGIRVAVKDCLIGSKQVKIYYLERNQEGGEHASTVHNPVLDDQGRIDMWPAGFFDEWDRSLEKLL